MPRIISNEEKEVWWWWYFICPTHNNIKLNLYIDKQQFLILYSCKVYFNFLIENCISLKNILMVNFKWNTIVRLLEPTKLVSFDIVLSKQHLEVFNSLLELSC